MEEGDFWNQSGHWGEIQGRRVPIQPESTDTVLLPADSGLGAVSLYLCSAVAAPAAAAFSSSSVWKGSSARTHPFLGQT